MFNNKNIFGIGKFLFVGAKQFGISDEFGGISLIYTAIHGNEDKLE